MDYPKIGQEIYIDTELYLSHGRDDFDGGLCTIIAIKGGKNKKLVPFVEVKERPGRLYNWKYLEPRQKELKKMFGKRRGCANPDMDPKFNEF